MPISREVETQLRRERVLELTSKGKTQTEIANILNYSQPTISNDVIYLRKKAKENLQNHFSLLPYQYEQAKSNLESLRKEAWALLEQTKDEKIKVSLYPIIQHLNESILQVAAAGDIIAQEVIAESVEAAKEAREALQEINEMQQQEINDDSDNDGNDIIDSQADPNPLWSKKEEQQEQEEEEDIASP
jgi:predicted transcriptional regulator